MFSFRKIAKLKEIMERELLQYKGNSENDFSRKASSSTLFKTSNDFSIFPKKKKNSENKRSLVITRAYYNFF